MARAISDWGKPTLRMRPGRRIGDSRELSRNPVSLLAVVLVAAWGCAETIHARNYPVPGGSRPTLQRIAVAPFTVRGQVDLKGVSAKGASASSAALLSRHVAEALAADGFDVVGPDEVRRVLAAGTVEVPAGHRGHRPGDPRSIAWLVRHHFGADGLVVGHINRFRDRVGESFGAERAASVGFDVTVYTAPDGKKVWSAAFDETQQPMLENVFNVSRYPGGGSRWLSADELARWGAREIALSLSSAQ